MSKLRMSGCAEDNFGQTQIRGSGIENDSSRLTVPSARGGTSCTTGETEKENQGENDDILKRYTFKGNIKTEFYVQFWTILHSKDDRCLC